MEFAGMAHVPVIKGLKYIAMHCFICRFEIIFQKLSKNICYTPLLCSKIKKKVGPICDHVKLKPACLATETSKIINVVCIQFLDSEYERY